MEKSAALGSPLSNHNINGSHKRRDVCTYDCKTVDSPHNLIVIGALRTKKKSKVTSVYNQGEQVAYSR